MSKPSKVSSIKKARETQRRRKAQQARRAREAAWALNGHVKPGSQPTPKPGTKAFKALQKQWYSKLASSGFQDIEWAGNPESPHIKQPSSRARKVAPGKQLYYAMARNFLTHFRFKSMQEKTAWAMHTDGKSYRQILDVMKADYGVHKSIYWVYYYVQATARKCRKFNTEHREGLLNPANADAQASDLLIGDWGLETAQDADSAEYGIQMDMGFWESVPKPNK